ncbi:GNAT family N-acetyltransferase [Enterococcus wangshanyuanii]|uniref:N-acetyltransferase n=1 Tax=Enterococcus wangshanyuanii TaxID=2005703 RepID=A0ABQ1PPY9_9ENTE|nr:GNAT family N-acetyltransferase [Enterococcus wangshanyuanii]GGD00974.1 N-acetyltransferase [Enterococcus wangshanyuanii]
MELRKATFEEGQTALEILKETAEWLKSIGSDQWSDVLNGEDKHGIIAAVKRNEVFFFYNNEKQLVGMVAAWQTPTEWDRLLWEKVEPDKNACYLHRVIIRPKYRKAGYGKELLNAIKNKFEKQIDELRLDCLASNQRLATFYMDNGFKHVDYSKDSTGTEFELFSYKMK